MLNNNLKQMFKIEKLNNIDQILINHLLPYSVIRDEFYIMLMGELNFLVLNEIDIYSICIYKNTLKDE
jgi:hypothetical protein